MNETQWKAIRRLVDAGMRPVDIARKFPKLVSAKQIYSKKRQWEREKYFKDPKNAIFHTKKYKALRLFVFKRDGFCCRICKKTGKGIRLEMDHILPRCARPDLTYDPKNCRTLCHKCHKKTSTYGYKAAYYKGKV